jgi:GH15 family glucan-1,4-alpha-glucosidase
LHAEICRQGFDQQRSTFTQSYGSVDANPLMLSLVGFLPAHDPRVIGTVEAIERHLAVDEFVLR